MPIKNKILVTIEKDGEQRTVNIKYEKEKLEEALEIHNIDMMGEVYKEVGRLVVEKLKIGEKNNE